MRTHQNTLFVQTQGSYLSRDHETVRVKVDGEVKLTVPLHHLESIVCFGRVSVSQALLTAGAERPLNIAFLTNHGRFLARVVPAVSGNVLLRREQYRLADRPEACLKLARPIVAAKIQNCRSLLLRSAREADRPEAAEQLRRAADRLACALDSAAQADTLDRLRGCEGDAARTYFAAFNAMIRQQGETFSMTERSRRPPLDPLNSLLSFLYALQTNDMTGALEAVGLDPAVGYLHVDRPGRLSLALDLVEEFRPLLADRLALSLINLRQVRGDGFQTQPGGAVVMDDKTRKAVLTALVQRKREEVVHPLLGERVPIGLLPHVQARLLARCVRGDVPEYPALVLK
jgi:CRISPR-associated protein Cas1